MKWKLILPIWLVAFLLAPSIWIHTLFMIGSRPPGSPQVNNPMLMPFGVIHFGNEFWGQLVQGDIADALIIFFFMILPILVYTLIISMIIYFVYSKIKPILDNRTTQSTH